MSVKPGTSQFYLIDIPPGVNQRFWVVPTGPFPEPEIVMKTFKKGRIGVIIILVLISFGSISSDIVCGDPMGESSLKAKIDKDPNDAESCLELGKYYNEGSNINEALKYLSKAVEINPRLSDGYLYLSIVYMQRGDMNRTIENMEKVNEINPDNPNILGNLVRFYTMANQKDKARAAYKRMIALNLPNRKKIMADMASFYEKVGWADEAKEIYLEISKENPGDSNANQMVNNSTIAEYKQKYNTTGHEVLLIESEAYGKRLNYEELDRLIGDIAGKMVVKNSYSAQDALDAFDTLSKLLFENRFIYVDVRSSLTDALILTNLNNKDIEKMMNPKEKEYVAIHQNEKFYKSDCFSKSILFVSIGETLGLPIHAVLAPSHVFVRWQFPDGSYVNWETTSNQSFPDSFYMKNRKISADAVKNGAYLKSLNSKETIGIIYDNVSRYFFEQKSYDRVLYFLDKALENNPQQVSAYNNKGIIYGKMKKFGQAIENFNKAIDLNSLETLSYCCRGLTWALMGDYERAFDDFDEAIKIDPSRADTYMARLGIKHKGRPPKKSAR